MYLWGVLGAGWLGRRSLETNISFIIDSYKYIPYTLLLFTTKKLNKNFPNLLKTKLKLLQQKNPALSCNLLYLLYCVYCIHTCIHFFYFTRTLSVLMHPLFVMLFMVLCFDVLLLYTCLLLLENSSDELMLCNSHENRI